MMFWNHLCKLWRKIRSQLSSDPLERCRWIKFPSVRQSRSEKQKDQLARTGEDRAAQYLDSKGIDILHRNIRFPEGELDFVAHCVSPLGEKTLVFIEVKTRATEEFGQPFQSVSAQKQRRQVEMANRFISMCRLQTVPVRFDVVSVVLSPDKPPKIEHYENAFRVNDVY
jgi:putative endonuclease